MFVIAETFKNKTDGSSDDGNGNMILGELACISDRDLLDYMDGIHDRDFIAQSDTVLCACISLEDSQQVREMSKKCTNIIEFLQKLMPEAERDVLIKIAFHSAVHKHASGV